MFAESKEIKSDKILLRASFSVNIYNQILPFVRLNFKSSSSNRHASFDHGLTSKRFQSSSMYVRQALLSAIYASIQIKRILNQSTQAINIS